MKKIFLLGGIFLMSCWTLFAQSEQVLDSLEQKLKNPALSVRERLIVYDDLSWYYAFFDFEKACWFAREGIAFAQKNKNKTEAVLYRNLGKAYSEYTLYDSAEVFYKKALSIAVKNNMSALESGLYSAMGDLYNLQCRYDKALMYYLKSIKMDEESGNKNSMCMNLANIGTMYANRRNYSKAEKYLLKAKKMAEEIGNKEVICTMLINLNNLYNETNRQEEGLNVILEAIEIAGEIGSYGHQVTALLSASTTCQDYEHDYQKAVDYSEQALKIAEFTGSPYYIMGCHRHLAASYAKWGKASHSEKHALTALNMADLTALRQSANTQFNKIDTTIHLIDQSIEEMRRMSHSLMPESLHRFGLKSALEDFCRKNVLIHFHFFGSEQRFEQNIEINFYRMGCELINNALKHANANQINVQLITSSAKLSLTVQDNGKGFNIQQIKQGMRTVRARADMLHATFNIFSNPGGGSEMTVDLEFIPLS